MHNPKLGNRAILLSFAVLLAFGSLFAQWGVLRLTDKDMQYAYVDLNGEPVLGGPLAAFETTVIYGVGKRYELAVYGLGNDVVLHPVHFPIWLLGATVIFALVITAANTGGVADVPRPLVAGLLAAAILLTVWEIGYLAWHGAAGFGGFLLLGAAGAVFWAQRPVEPPPLLLPTAPLAPSMPPGS